jgi:hypothetical protein
MRTSGERAQSQIGHRNSQILRPSGDHSAVDPPVPIPNTEVKRCSPDGSATIGCARVGRRQNRKPGEFISPGFLHLLLSIRHVNAREFVVVLNLIPEDAG